MPPTGRTASRPLPSAAPAERRQSFHREPGDVSSGNVYQRFTRRLSNAKKPAQDLNINDEADDLFSSVPTTPREKPANVEAFELQEQQGSRTSDTAAPDSNLRRKGSLLDKLDNSSRKGSVESNVPTEEANTTSLKALCHLGVVPTRSAKAASILTGYSNKDALEQRKQVKSFASTDTGFSDEDAATYSGLEPFPQPNFSREPRPLKTSQASSFSQPVSAAGPARHLRTMSINSAKATQSLNGPSKPSSQTLACAYIVGGLPKQPSHWTVAEHDAPPAHAEGALDRWWKPEVLGSSVVGEHIQIDDLDGSKEAVTRKAGKKNSKAKSKSATTGTPALSPDEVAKIQSKVLKLSYTKDAEVVASTLAPPASSHYFSFTVPVGEDEHSSSGPGGAGQAFDLIINSTTARQSFAAGESTRYYAVSLQIWSHADKSRSTQIRQALEGSQRKDRAHALKAAAQGRRFGKKLESKLASGAQSTYSAAETDVETEAFMSETDADLPRPAANSNVTNLPLWLPYHLVLVSRWPLFDLMLDHIKVHWARFNTEIAKHSLAMSSFMNTPAPRPGETIKASAGAEGVVFTTSMPGKMNLSAEGFVESNTTCWPLFSCLSADHLLTICEVALSPMGRVIFFSRHPIMLSMAVETMVYILELKGWSSVGGVAHHQCHARDLRLFVEDPGPYILGVHDSCRALTTHAPTEVLKVDLDMDELECGRFHPGSLSIGRQRERDIKILESAIDRPSAQSPGVPREWAEAYPAGRFRPLSVVEANGRITSAERLLPPSNWSFNPTAVFAAFDQVLSHQPASGFMSIFKKQVPRKLAKLDPSTAHVQAMIRSHTSTFVNRRDQLESKLWKLNRRMASLATEAASWARTYETFSTYSKSLAKQQEELKGRLDKERKEAKRLSAQVTEQKQSHGVLQQRLKETEEARVTAEKELLEASKVREDLEARRQMMIQELSTAMVSGTEDDRPSSAASAPIDGHGRRNAGRRRSSSLGSIGSGLEGFSDDGLTHEERDAMERRHASQEAMAKMQARLQAVLRMARADEHGSLRSVDDVAADSSDDDLDTEPAKRNSKQRIAPSRSSKLNGKQSHQSFTPTVDSTASSETAESFEDASTKRVDGKKRQVSENGSSASTSSSQRQVPSISINGEGGSKKSAQVSSSAPTRSRTESSDTDASSTTTGAKRSSAPRSSKSAKRRSYNRA